jgi:Holliday junction resolvasome RuvABC endonuclease subunit
MRILALSPHSKGFGLVIFEDNYNLLDWGLKYCRTTSTSTTCSKTTPAAQLNRNCLTVISQLIEYYEPDVVITEDWTASTCKRHKRVKKLLSQIQLLANKQNLQCCRFSRLQIQKQFAEYQVKTKQEIAVCLSSLFAELTPYLPKPRKLWMSENPRIHIFTALSLCLVFTETTQNTSNPKRT